MAAWRLFFLGYLTLYLELALIRYLPGTIWNLGYFPNLVLMGVFVGMGFGFLLHHRIAERRSPLIFGVSPIALLLLFLLVHLLSPGVPGFGWNIGEIGEEIYFTAKPPRAGGESILLFGLWFLGVVILFALISQRTAKIFRLFPPLRAYTLDIAGSCLGIVSFMALSYLQVPAFVWFALACPLFVVCAGRLLPSVPFVAIAALAWWGDTRPLKDPASEGRLDVTWSPYQKVELFQGQIYVNGIHHQSILPSREIRRLWYARPHEYRKGTGRGPYRSVLVIGAGAGNDVVAALLHGAESVDAVEIDPAIASLGSEHPGRPYVDPRVSLIVDDGRAFMTRTEKRYDLIIFALTDSLVKVSSMGQLRLENYPFTKESIGKACGLLEPDGDIVLYNYYRREWLVGRYREMLHEATGRHPLTIHQEGMMYVLIAGPETSGPPAEGKVSGVLPTDDWPFPYLPERGIPSVYLRALAAVAVLILLMGALQHRLRPVAGFNRAKIAFFIMGAAFLLLETKSIVQFSLLFGTTWLNSSLVFLAVLLLVLAANWTATVLRRPSVLPAVYLLLIASCLVGYFFPVGGLLSVGAPLLRFILASLLTFSPIFFANLLFSVTFRDQVLPEHLFGWNLLGASVGGLIEYSSMAIGYNALALVVAVAYTLVIAALAGRRGS
jgi:hypothetical protein